MCGKSYKNILHLSRFGEDGKILSSLGVNHPHDRPARAEPLSRHRRR